MTAQRRQPSSSLLACDANRLSIPAAVRAKGYSDVKASDGTLQMQVRHHALQKIKAGNTPCPESAAASLLPTLATAAATAARPALWTITLGGPAHLLPPFFLFWRAALLVLEHQKTDRRRTNRVRFFAKMIIAPLIIVILRLISSSAGRSIVKSAIVSARTIYLYVL